jgi:hypothetical protein
MGNEVEGHVLWFQLGGTREGSKDSGDMGPRATLSLTPTVEMCWTWKQGAR